MFVMLIQVSASSYSQNTKLSLSGQNLTIEQVLSQIEDQSEFSFFYNVKEVDLSKVVSMNIKDRPINEVMDFLLDETGMTYTINNKLIVIHQGQGTGLNGISVQQKQEVKGKVTNQSGEPVPGATVVVKGSTMGVVTDFDGNYTLQNVPPDATLVFSFVGMKSQEVKVTGKTIVNLKMEEETIGIEEVVAIGYGTQKKVNLTGAVDQVTNEVFENRSVSNVTQALQGVVPNLNITLKDGKPSRSSSFNVRGTTSIGQKGSALVLIDGVEGDPALLNPNDIESVSVLKDAASSAIYGARGTFGVVLITTKSPTKGKITVSYSGNFSLQRPVAVPDNVTDGYVWAERFREAYNAWNNYSSLPSKINKSQVYSDAWLQTFKERKEQGITEEVVTEANGKYTYYGNTDYYDILYRDQSFAQDHNVMISGGNEKSDFYISGRLYDYNGLFEYNSDVYQMANIRAKGSLQVYDWLRITNNMEFSDMDYHNPINVGEGGSIWRNIADEGHPTSPVFNPDGSLTMSAAYTVGDFIYGKNGIDTNKKVLKNTTGLTAKFFNDKLRVNGDFTFRNYDNNETQKRVPVPYSTQQGITTWLSTKYNDLKESTRNTFYTATNLYAEYEDTFADDHYFKGMMGYNYETSEYKSTYVQRNGLLLEDAESLNLALGESIVTSAGYEKWRIAGAFFRFNYGYKDRYLLEFNGRYDGSSKFPEDQQYAFFPSVSAGWRISEEPFWNVDRNLFSDVKVRASYGSLGNGNIEAYKFQELLAISTSGRVLNGALNKYTNNPAVIPNSLTWETATTTDFGLDFGMVNSKLRFTGDYYIRKTTDMYTVGMTLPEIFGADSPKGNYADMTTRGWELSLTWKDKFLLASKPFNYEVRATLHDYKSEIDSYNNSTKALSDYYEGMTVGEIWGYKTDGLFQSQDEITGYVNTIIKSSSNKTIYPGDLKFVDNNKSGAIDYGDKTLEKPGDKVILGNTEPRYIYSFMLDADWNGFFVSAFFQGVGEQHWFPDKESGFWGQYNRPYNNLPTWHLNNYWTEDNRDAYLPRYAGYNESVGYGGSNAISDRYLQNIAYIRLKNFQVGYTLPKNWTSKVHMENARIYVSGENIWSWSPLYKHTKDFDVTNTAGSDPDLTSETSGDNYSYPLMKSISLGLSVTF
ncbi:MAG TPA: SusC/RagA family protein [Prolixibacteraceae bacterium]|nr:SusC/RagA family protein [Prolixibacteraceae bacterium]HCU62021.1 SusC/RagA family protein [Prolixibacteraceae bacterium]